MRAASDSSARASQARALLIAAADDETAARALARLRREMPGLHITAVARPGASIPADTVIAAPASGPYGFALSLSLLRQLRRGCDLACALVSDLDSPAFRRVALLLRLARAERKLALGPGGETVQFGDWLDRAGISVGAISLARAGFQYNRTPAESAF